MEESLGNHLFYDFKYTITLKVIQSQIFMMSAKKNGESFLLAHPRVHNLTFELLRKLNVLLRDLGFYDVVSFCLPTR